VTIYHLTTVHHRFPAEYDGKIFTYYVNHQMSKRERMYVALDNLPSNTCFVLLFSDYGTFQSHMQTAAVTLIQWNCVVKTLEKNTRTWERRAQGRGKDMKQLYRSYVGMLG
jgi:hypothetical protein